MSDRLEQDADGEENFEFPICCPHLVVSIRGPFWVPYCMIGKFNVDFTQGAEVNGTSVADVGWVVSDVIARWTLHRQRSGEEGVAV